jgi:NTE family protein
MGSNLGLVMTGGGARGAYQAGVLKRIGEIRSRKTPGNPFPIIGGSSAGAVNGGALAAGCDEFGPCTSLLAKLWADLTPSDVFRCDLLSQAANSLTWILDLSFGGALGGGNARYLLDATPLRRFLSKHLFCERIQANINQGHLYALAISATNYNSGKSYLFIQGRPGHPMWDRSRRVTLSTQITVDHICASAAIPLVFQPVKLQTELGTAYFGDGCIRLQQPLSPIIRLGAEKLVAISVRGENVEERNGGSHRDPSLAEVIGVLFDVMFLDHLTADIEHLDRLNQLLSSGQIERSTGDGCERMRPLKYILIAPSVRISEVAAQHQKSMPYQIQYFVNSLGRDAASVADLMSYLLFTPRYTRELIEIGYQDASRRIDEIETFLNTHETC